VYAEGGRGETVSAAARAQGSANAARTAARPSAAGWRVRVVIIFAVSAANLLGAPAGAL
jgi:hypothetical protein